MAENNCVVCFKNCCIYSIGECDHPVCYECSTRMRVLCRQNECPMCRHEMAMVVFTERIRPFRRLKKTYALYDSQHNIAFENSYIREAYESLLHYVCQKCQRRPIFDSFESVNEHMKRDHDLYCCELCAENLKIFPAERRYYTKQELNRHRRIGDVDDRSHRGHPLCEFCDIRYVDRDELYRHLRKEHLFCHICDSEGIQQFYGMYEMLREHYKKDHFLCEEGECFKEQLTSVFPTEIDLKAHKALVHCKNLRNKQAVKQARTLELEFSLPPRSHSERYRGRPSNVESEENTCGQNNQCHDSSQSQNITASWEHDFPSLTSSTSYALAKPKFIRDTSKKLTYDDRNFPALGSETNVSLNIRSTVYNSCPLVSDSVTSTNTSVKIKRDKSKSQNSVEQQKMINGPSSSTLSLTWVNKKKDKKPPDSSAQTPTPPNVPIKPPPLSGNNFPSLQKNVIESDKKSKKSAPSVHVNEHDNQRVKVNYREAIAAKSSSSEAKVNNDKDATSKFKEKLGNNSKKSSGENKTHCFLLNANRKKVKMKPETFTMLNDQFNQNVLTKPTVVDSSLSVDDTKPCKADKVNSRSKKSRNRNNFNARSSDNEEKVNDNNEKHQAKQTRETGQHKDGEKRENSQQRSNKENELHNIVVSGSMEKKKKNSPKQCNGVSKTLKNENSRKKEMETNEKKKTDQKRQHLKQVSDSNVEQPAETGSSGNASTASAVNNPPPGLGKPGVLPVPPGFVPLQNGFSNQFIASKNAISSFSNLMSDSLLVYQQPDDFVSRNSQLIEKIKGSLIQANEDKLEEFKKCSVLFRDGHISATEYYFYCLENIRNEKFVDVFVDLVILLPNILKQQELWAIHETAMPSNAKTPQMWECPICFQILKLNDTLAHLGKHGVTIDSVMQCTGVAK